MAFFYKFKLKCSLTKKMDKFINFKLKMNKDCQIFSRIMFGYNKLEEEEEEFDTLENVNKHGKGKVIRMLLSRRNYQQF